MGEHKKKFVRNTTVAAFGDVVLQQQQRVAPVKAVPEPKKTASGMRLTPTGLYDFEPRTNSGVLRFVVTDWPPGAMADITIERRRYYPPSLGNTISDEIVVIAGSMDVGTPEGQTEPAYPQQKMDYSMAGSYRTTSLVSPYNIEEGPTRVTTETHVIRISPRGGNRDYFFRVPIHYGMVDRDAWVVRAEACQAQRRLSI